MTFSPLVQAPTPAAWRGPFSFSSLRSPGDPAASSGGGRGGGAAPGLAAQVVRPVAAPLEQDGPAQPAVAASAAAQPAVVPPELEPVAVVDPGDLGRVQELGQVLELPQAPGPGVVGESVQVDQVDSVAPPARGQPGGGVAVDV